MPRKKKSSMYATSVSIHRCRYYVRHVSQSYSRSGDLMCHENFFSHNAEAAVHNSPGLLYLYEVSVEEQKYNQSKCVVLYSVL